MNNKLNNANNDEQNEYNKEFIFPYDEEKPKKCFYCGDEFKKFFLLNIFIDFI